MDNATVLANEASEPTFSGISKKVYDLRDGRCLVRMVPSLTSFTHDRHEIVPGTDRIRLDFYERAAGQLTKAGILCVFEQRIDDTAYIARFCPSPPFEVIVKNVAAGSTLRKYPGLFKAGERFATPVVKFDFRTVPEDQPIAEDYVREYGLDVNRMKAIALEVNDVMRQWLAPRVLWDFCVVIGMDIAEQYYVASEISPDCMRLRSPEGAPLDKDLFRRGASANEICRIWSELVASLDCS
jgi:phosphoribosylaminoimidazole-succinocarboxamide synthase